MLSFLFFNNRRREKNAACRSYRVNKVSVIRRIVFLFLFSAESRKTWIATEDGQGLMFVEMMVMIMILIDVLLCGNFL